MSKQLGDFILRSSKHGEFDCDVYVLRSSSLRGEIWVHVASFRELEDAERAYPQAKFFDGHSGDCDCVGPEDFDCDDCANYNGDDDELKLTNKPRPPSETL